ncbi:hypothetical protein HPB51_018774 [Rhipicephalus microplus]|uniref:Uncharacterized protein n=1 Tax=Rhipicephalus microplus TaxID=6941 RepID=A0A9J6DI81_RHIMP|nr:hypothetical protein HPB51_018774 [Rhipicephalus microplus]
MVPHALTDVDPWAFGAGLLSSSSSPSGRKGFGKQPETQNAEELLDSEKRDLSVTASVVPASQSTHEHGTAFDHSPADQARIEALQSVALCSIGEGTVSPEEYVHAQCSNNPLTIQPRKDVPGEQALQQKCVREGCSNPSVQSNEWDGEYCSSECVVLQCKKVFSEWVTRRLENQSTLQCTV